MGGGRKGVEGRKGEPVRLVHLRLLTVKCSTSVSKIYKMGQKQIKLIQIQDANGSIKFDIFIRNS